MQWTLTLSSDNKHLKGGGDCSSWMIYANNSFNKDEYKNEIHFWSILCHKVLHCYHSIGVTTKLSVDSFCEFFSMVYVLGSSKWVDNYLLSK